MKRKRIYVIIFLILVLLITSGAIFYSSAKKRIIKSVVPSIEDFYINDLVIQNGKGRAHLILFLENKDVINYHVKTMDLSLTNSSLELVKYQRDSSYILLAGEKKEFHLEFDLDTQQLVKRIRSLQSKDSTSVNIKGNILFDTYFGDYKLDIDKSIKIRVPTPPDINIREVEYLGVRNVDSIDFNIHIGVLNYNPNILGIKNVKYHFKSEDFFEAHGDLPDVLLDTSDTIVRIVPVTIVTKRKMELLSKIILNQDVLEYEMALDGILLLDNDKQNEIRVSVSKRDKLEVLRKNKKSKIKFTNKRKKERKAKRDEKRANQQ